jgi:hypothetical protein
MPMTPVALPTPTIVNLASSQTPLYPTRLSSFRRSKRPAAGPHFGWPTHACTRQIAHAAAQRVPTDHVRWPGVRRRGPIRLAAGAKGTEWPSTRRFSRRTAPMVGISSVPTWGAPRWAGKTLMNCSSACQHSGSAGSAVRLFASRL